jgi:hypothetical protein
MSHPANAGFQAGNHWVNCPRCAFDYRASEMRKEWTGQYVCHKCWEPRHPQDFVRVSRDSIAPVGPVNAEPEPVYRTVDGEDQLEPTPSMTFGKDFSP